MRKASGKKSYGKRKMRAMSDAILIIPRKIPINLSSKNMKLGIRLETQERNAAFPIKLQPIFGRCC